jgi:hypothetical protein
MKPSTPVHVFFNRITGNVITKWGTHSSVTENTGDDEFQQALGLAEYLAMQHFGMNSNKRPIAGVWADGSTVLVLF